MKPCSFFLFAVLLGLAPLAPAQQMGVIDDPDGYVNVRAEKSTETAVIATVKNGEPFSFESEPGSDWCKVTLHSGKSGWMHDSRIRLYFTEKDLPAQEKDPAGPSEIEEFARGRGFNYARDTRRAAHGDVRALQKFFEIANDADGAAAESIAGMPAVVYHLLGDEKFARFLGTQALPYRMIVRNLISGSDAAGHGNEYLRQHFPQTAAMLFRREMVDWNSPNDLYAIRKVFTADLQLSGSKVERAELIEKKSGRVLCDLTPDDIGTGAQREGEALWSPDSKRVACLSSDLTEQQGNLFGTPRPAPLRKQTAVYQLAGDSFARVDLSLGKVPGRENDEELKGAIMGHEYTEPIRWQKPNVLILQRHEYYRKTMPTTVDNLTFDSIHDLARAYQITATIAPAGKATVVWKLREDR